MATRTWISDVAANSDSGFDGTPEEGDDLLFTSAHTGKCTINQALTFGTITLESGCGEVDHGAVDFGYSDLLMNGGVLVGSLSQWQTCTHSFIHNAGTINTSVLSLKFVGAVEYQSNATLGRMWVASGITTKTRSNSIATYLRIDPGAELKLAIASEFRYYAGSTYINNGVVSGASIFTISFYSGDKTSAIGNVQCPLVISLVSTSAASRKWTMNADTRLGSTLTIKSNHVTNTMTLDLNGYGMVHGGIVSDTRGVFIAGEGLIRGPSVDSSAGALTEETATWVFEGANGTIKLATGQSLYNVIVKASAVGLALGADATVDNLLAYINPIAVGAYDLTKTKPENEYTGLRRPVVKSVKMLDVGPVGMADEWLRDLGAVLA